MRQAQRAFAFAAALIAGSLFCFAQSFGQLTMTGAGGGGFGGGGSGCTEATNFLARNGNAHATDTTTLICGMVSDGVWSSLDALWVFATDTSAHALLSLVSATYNATASGSPTFTADQGYSSSANTDFVDTNFKPSTVVGSNYSLNAASFGFWGYAALGSPTTTLPMGTSANNSSGEDNLFPWYTDGKFYPCVNSATCSGITNSQTQGLMTADRFSSTAIHAYRNGAEIGTGVTDTATALATNDYTVLAGAPGGGAAYPGKISAAYVGGTLGATKQGQLYARLRTYMTAVGVP